MKKFKYKLESLLRLRTIKEDKIKIELGEIVRLINIKKEEIKRFLDEIAWAFDNQDRLQGHQLMIEIVEFYSNFIQTKREHIQKNENEIEKLKEDYDKKIEELKIAMGEVKIIANLKEKDRKKYKKYTNKKMQEEIDENFVMRFNGLSNKKKTVGY
jgi:flagellar FliJ protein